MAEQLPISDSAKLPARVGRYRVLCELGTGSMASLYLGRAGGLGGFERLFALKVVHPHLCRKPAFIEMFLNEARIAASVHHPNVVPVYEVDVDDGQYFLAMDYVSGETLALLLRSTWNMKRELPTRIAAHIVASAAEGLHAAHELTDANGTARNVVHRDVAPQNIMIGYDGIVRVTDFGIAKALDTVSQTKPGVLKGTVAYMSPEQVRGQDLDRRVDVFALGVLLWEATTGLRLFKDSTELRTAGRILRMNVPPPSTMHDDYPEALDRIVMRALARDRDDRYPTARALSEDLFAFLDSEERVTASEMERYVKGIFAERLEHRRALERDAADPEPPENIGDHLSDASETLGLEHFTAQEAWDALGSDEVDANDPADSIVAELSAALRGAAGISDGTDPEPADTQADRPKALPRNIVEKHHATTSKMPIPKFSEGAAKVLAPKSILPSGRVSVKVEADGAPKPRAEKKSILPPLDKSARKKKDDDDELTAESIGSAIEAALAAAPDAAADAPTLDEEPGERTASPSAAAVVTNPDEANVADPANAPRVGASSPAAEEFESDAPEVTRLPRSRGEGVAKKSEHPALVAVPVRKASEAKDRLPRTRRGESGIRISPVAAETPTLEKLDADAAADGEGPIEAAEDAIGAAVDALFGGGDDEAKPEPNVEAKADAEPTRSVGADAAAKEVAEATPVAPAGTSTKSQATDADAIEAGDATAKSLAPKVGAQTGAKPKATDARAEAETSLADAAPKAEGEANANAASKPKADADAAPLAKAEAKTALAEAAPLAKAEANANANAASTPKVKADSDAAPLAEAEANANAASKPEAKAEAKTALADAAPLAEAESNANDPDATVDDTIGATRAELVFSSDTTKPSGPIPKFSQRDVQTALIRDTGPIPLAAAPQVAIPAEDTKPTKTPAEPTALIRTDDVVEVDAADVEEIGPEDTKRVPNPLPAETEAEAAAPLDAAPIAEAEFEPDDDDPPWAESRSDEDFGAIAAEEQNARRTRVIALAAAAVLLLGTIFVLWPSGDAPEPVASAEAPATEAPADEPVTDEAVTEAPDDDATEEAATDDPELVAPRPLAAAAPEAPPKPETISLRVEASPPGAQILLDGRPYTGALDVPRDSEDEHVVRVQAPGHAPQMIVVDAATDRVVRVKLEREAPPPEAAASEAEPRTKKVEKRRRRRRSRREAKKRTRKKNEVILFDGEDL